MTFDQNERAILAALADVLIPASPGFLSASEAGVAGEGLDQVLSLRPDVATPLKAVLQSARGREPAEFISALPSEDAPGFAALAEAVAGAYFLNPQVRAALRYHGQVPRPIDPAASDLEGELLEPVIRRGRVYRPTPGTDPKS
jgi:hypothetical protein